MTAILWLLAGVAGGLAWLVGRRRPAYFEPGERRARLHRAMYGRDRDA